MNHQLPKKNPMNFGITPSRYRTLALGVAAVCALLLLIGSGPKANADPYQPIHGTLKDRALLFELEPGTRRIRMQIRNPETDLWDTYSVAHLRGDEMFFKVRIPDDVDVADCRIHASRADPFPYTFYEGRTTFDEEEGAGSPTSPASSGGPSFAANILNILTVNILTGSIFC